MAKAYEELCERGVLSYTADEAEGITVNSLMFRKRLTRVELGRLWGLLPAAVESRLHGENWWSPDDLFCCRVPWRGVDPLLPA